METTQMATAQSSPGHFLPEDRVLKLPALPEGKGCPFGRNQGLEDQGLEARPHSLQLGREAFWKPRPTADQEADTPRCSTSKGVLHSSRESPPRPLLCLPNLSEQSCTY